MSTTQWHIWLYELSNATGIVKWCVHDMICAQRQTLPNGNAIQQTFVKVANGYKWIIRDRIRADVELPGVDREHELGMETPHKTFAW